MAAFFQASEILVKDAELKAIELENSVEILQLIETTQQRQEEILKLKIVDQDNLRMVVQL